MHRQRGFFRGEALDNQMLLCIGGSSAQRSSDYIGVGTLTMKVIRSPLGDCGQWKGHGVPVS